MHAPDPAKARFASALRQARQAKGLSMVAFAGAVGVSRGAAHAWENPDSPSYPQKERWPQIERVLGIGERELRFGAGALALPGAERAYPRHVEALVKRFEADVEDAAISDGMRAGLLALVRSPELVELYRARFASGAQDAEEQRRRIGAHLTAFRILMNGFVVDLAGVHRLEYPVAEEGATFTAPAVDRRGRTG